MGFSMFRTKLRLNQSKTTLDKARKFKKWNRLLSTVVACLTFLLLLGYVMYNLFSSSGESSSDAGLVEASTSTVLVSTIASSIIASSSTKTRNLVTDKCVVISDMITCNSAGADENIADLVNTAASSEGLPSPIRLELISCNFPSDTLNYGWLNTSDVIIRALIIKTTNLTDLGEQAFSGYPFEDLDYLEIHDSNVTTLSQKTFLNTPIEEFLFGFSNFTRGITVEAFVLEGMANTLRHLQLKNCLDDPQVVHNLTGITGSRVFELRILDLSSNNLNHLMDYSFLNASNLEVLFLQNNEINEIELETFQGLDLLETLNLSSNSLQMLPEGVFDDLVNLNHGLHVYDNPFECNCDLQWFKDYIAETEAVAEDIPIICLNYEQDILEVEMCTTPEPDVEYVPISCRNLLRQPNVISPDVKRSFLDSAVIRNGGLILHIFEVSMNNPTFEISMTGDLRDYHMLWHNARNSSDGGCVSHLFDPVVMENLQRKTTYTICLIYGNNTMASPFDCFGFPVPSDWSEDTWIANKYRKVVIITTILLAFLLLITSVAATVYCIRRYPHLIADNKKIIMVGSRSSEAIIMPKGYPAKPRALSHNNGRCDNFEILNRKNTKLRSLSESSVLSVSSYVVPNVPSGVTSISSKCSACVPKLEIEANDHIYEKPPLPPLRPNELAKGLV